MKESLGSGLFIVSSRVGSRLGLCNRHNGWTRYRRVHHTSRLWFPLSFVRQGHCQGNSGYTCIFADTSMSFQITDRVHNKVVTGSINANGTIVRLFESQIGQKVHEPFKQADTALCLTTRLGYQGNVLVLDTSFIIRVSHLVSTGYVAKSQCKVTSLAQFVMHFLTEHSSDIRINHT